MLMMTDSRDLLEIPREDFCGDSRLWIENASMSEALTVISGFLIALIATFATAGSGPPTINTQKAERLFTNLTEHQYRFGAYPLSAYNRFVSFELSFLRSSPSANPAPVSFSYQVECLHQASQIKALRKRVDNLKLRPSKNGTHTVKIPLFMDRLIKYDTAELKLNLSRPALDSYTGLAVFTALGTHGHTTYQAYFRFLYSAVEIIGIILLCWNPGIRRFGSWTRELRLTFPLLFLAVLSNNPLYVWHAFRPLSVFEIIDAFATPLFHSYSILLCMLMIDFVVNKNVRFTILHLLWWILVAFSLFVCEFIKSMASLIASFASPSIPPLRMSKYVEYGQIVAHALFFLFALYFLVGLGPGVDVTERVKFWGYSLALVIAMGYSLVVIILGKLFRLFEGTMTEWIGAFGVYNVFTLMVMYFHWPLFPVNTYQESGSNPAFLKGLGVVEETDPVMCEIDSDIDPRARFQFANKTPLSV
jgi:hypothetical protein